LVYAEVNRLVFFGTDEVEDSQGSLRRDRLSGNPMLPTPSALPPRNEGFATKIVGRNA